MDQLSKAPHDTNGIFNHATVVGRSSAANAHSIAGRNEVISFARQYANLAPTYEPAWSPHPILKGPSFLQRFLATFQRG